MNTLTIIIPIAIVIAILLLCAIRLMNKTLREIDDTPEMPDAGAPVVSGEIGISDPLIIALILDGTISADEVEVQS